MVRNKRAAFRCHVEGKFSRDYPERDIFHLNRSENALTGQNRVRMLIRN